MTASCVESKNLDSFPADSRSCANDISICVFVGFLPRTSTRALCCPIISRRKTLDFSLISVYEFVIAGAEVTRPHFQTTLFYFFYHHIPLSLRLFTHFIRVESPERYSGHETNRKGGFSQASQEEMINSKVSLALHNFFFFSSFHFILSFSNYATFTICFSFFFIESSTLPSVLLLLD